VTEYFFPNFFDYPYINIPFRKENLYTYWPLLVYAATVALVSSFVYKVDSTEFDHEIFIWFAGNSIIGGIFEEIQFRWLLICAFMISIVFSNYFIKVACVIIGYQLMMFNFKRMIVTKNLRFIGLILLGVAFVALSTVNLLYLVYDYIILPFTNFITLGFFQHIFYGQHSKLLVFGMATSNGLFRDAHKYDGQFGRINAWFVGFIMMSCTLSYGLYSAIALHAIYDLEFAVIRFVIRRLKHKPTSYLSSKGSIII